MKKADSKKEETKKVVYTAKVLRAKEIKEGTIAFDMEVNGVKINGCFYREYTNKKGEEGVMISYPSRKGSNDEYYDICWFPMSKELREDIIKQLEELV